MSYTDLDLNNSSLITIDFQNDFVFTNGATYIPGSEENIETITSLTSIYRGKKRPIVHVIRIYLPDGSNVNICRKEIIEEGKSIVNPGSRGINIVESILGNKQVELDTDLLLRKEFQQIGDNEWIMYKSRWGAFYETDLESFLKSKGIDSIIVCGCNFPNCPRTTIYEASERDFKIGVVENTISRIYEKGVAELRSIGVSMLSENDL